MSQNSFEDVKLPVRVENRGCSHDFSTSCQNLEKNWGHRKNGEKAGLKVLRRLMLFFGEVDQ